jgi:hypothetical protein
MKRKITQIRELSEIEKQLNDSQVGILSIHLDTEKIMQIACNFVYLDKNVYIYLDKNDENFEHIKYGAIGNFSVFKNEISNPKSKNNSYRLFYVTVDGEIKDIDDPKLADQVTELYRKKYSASIKAEEYKVSEYLKPIILDSKEIKAVLEEGI